MPARAGRSPGGAPPRSGRALIVSFVAVAVAFLTSTVVAERNDLEIQRAATEIARNVSPSIQRLAELRTDLQRFTTLAHDEVDRGSQNGGAVPTPEVLLHAQALMTSDWETYRAIPAFRGERELWQGVVEAQARMAAMVSALLTDMNRGDWREARRTLDGRLKPASIQLDTTIMRIIDFDAKMGAELGRRIDALGGQSIRMAIVLDSLCVLLTFGTAWLLMGFIRRYTSFVERRAEELELFAGRVAHDVLGPLSAASLALDRAELEAPVGSRTRRIIESGKAGLRRAKSVTDGLLEFARAGARAQADDHADVLEVVRAVADEVEPAARERGIAISVDVTGPCEVACSPGILTSVVSNLVRNAVKYVGDQPNRRVDVRARAAGRAAVRLEVEDNGPGLPPGLGDQIWQPHVRGATSGQPGIGLGLATVKKIAEAHGGRVDVSSAPGRGCRFVVELPARQTPGAPPRPPARRGRPEGDADGRWA